MPKHSGYMDRALKAHDPRFARILGKLGYDRRDMVAAETDVDDGEDDLSELRAEYQDVVGKRAYHAWSADELREKIAAASEADD